MGLLHQGMQAGREMVVMVVPFPLADMEELPPRRQLLSQEVAGVLLVLVLLMV